MQSYLPALSPRPGNNPDSFHVSAVIPAGVRSEKCHMSARLKSEGYNPKARSMKKSRTSDTGLHLMRKMGLSSSKNTE